MNPTLNSKRPQLPPAQHAQFVDPYSAVRKSETDTSEGTFRIPFIAHPMVVPGRAVVNGTSKNTGGKITRKPVELPRRQMRFTT